MKDILRILQYNIFCRPDPFNDAQLERSKNIPKAIKKMELIFNISIDVITICESFNNESSEKLINLFYKYGFIYHTHVLGNEDNYDEHIAINLPNKKYKRFTLTNGGVLILSKYPINKIGYRYFNINELSGTDVFSAKGVVYAQIQKNDFKYNIFATHLQAWNNKENIQDRYEEIDMINEYITELKNTNIIKNEPIILCGDLNVDYIKNKNQYKIISKKLNNYPFIIVNNNIYNNVYTSDPIFNNLVGRDGQNKPYKREWLDYVLCLKNDKLYSVINKIECIKLYKFSNKYFYIPKECCMCCYGFKKLKTKNLSDHFPILSTITFIY